MCAHLFVVSQQIFSAAPRKSHTQVFLFFVALQLLVLFVDRRRRLRFLEYWLSRFGKEVCCTKDKRKRVRVRSSSPLTLHHTLSIAPVWPGQLHSRFTHSQNPYYAWETTVLTMMKREQHRNQNSGIRQLSLTRWKCWTDHFSGTCIPQITTCVK